MSCCGELNIFVVFAFWGLVSVFFAANNNHKNALEAEGGPCLVSKNIFYKKPSGYIFLKWKKLQRPIGCFLFYKKKLSPATCPCKNVLSCGLKKKKTPTKSVSMMGLGRTRFILVLVALHVLVTIAGRGVRNIRSHAEYKKFLKVCILSQHVPLQSQSWQSVVVCFVFWIHVDLKITSNSITN